ncbi:hypothetical protein SESBI_49237, partial [Sesbania bispinosa]
MGYMILCGSSLINGGGGIIGQSYSVAGEQVNEHVFKQVDLAKVEAHKAGPVAELYGPRPVTKLYGPREESLSGPSYVLYRRSLVCVVQSGMEGGGHLHVIELEKVVGDKDNASLRGEGDAQEGGSRDCFKENESVIAQALCLLNDDVLCEVPIIEDHGLDLFFPEMKKIKSCGQDGREKRRRGRPKKQVLQSSEVNDSNLQLVQTVLALDQGPSEIADHVWNM